MNRRFFVLILVSAIILSVSFFGCKSRADRSAESQMNEMQQMPLSTDTLVTTEPAQMVATTEAIPPTAAPEMAPMAPGPFKADAASRNKDIQTALKNAGFYTGSIDGKIGPKTKRAIEEFQKARALKVDGKVGPKTWAELEKYLIQQ